MAVNNNWLAHLMRYSYKELRRRQSVNQQQLEVANAASFCPMDSLKNLNEMADTLTEAILIKTGSED